jgi:hypothetical protein
LGTAHFGLGIQLTIEEMLVVDGIVAVGYTQRGTFRDLFLGHELYRQNLRIGLVAMEWFVLRDGKI